MKLNGKVNKMSITEKLGKASIPGFRSGKKWKMAIAIFGYLFIALILLVIVSPSPPTPQQSPRVVENPAPIQAIYIKQSSQTTDNIGGIYNAAEGKTYLIVNLEIENRGYAKFSTNPLYWKVEVDKLGYSYSPATYSLPNKLDMVDIQNGGKIKGTLAFEVPAKTDKYTLQYDAIVTKYNLVQVK